MWTLFLGISYFFYINTLTAITSERFKRQEDCTGNDKFRCHSGMCIDAINTCDGYDDCWDTHFGITNVSSDETIALCINRRCPKFAFKCAYGGCIDKEKKCNGVQDCYDSSDEDKELCREAIYDPSDNKILSDGRCEVLTSPNAITKCFVANIPTECGKSVKIGTKMIVECKHGFHKYFSNTFCMETVCLGNGNWKPKPHDDCTDCGRRYSFGDFTPLLSYSEKTKGLEYPWHAGLYENLSNVTRYMCGGSIIHPRAILTAAHCVYDEKAKSKANRNYSIVVGKYHSSWKIEDVLEQRLRVKEIHIAPYYLGSENRYEQDIAILELENDIHFNSAVSAVCLDWKQEYHLNQSTFGTVVGWGKTEKESVSEELRVAQLNSYNFHECREKTREGFQTFITPDKICAGLGNDTSVQEGDSGGGLTFPFPVSKDNSSVYYIHGIVSIKDTWSNDLAAFTKVNDYLSWIKKILISITKDTC